MKCSGLAQKTPAFKNLYGVFITLFSCKEDSQVDEAVAKIPIEFKVERFDKIFYESKPEDLQGIKAQYPFFFPEGNPDSIWVNKLKNPLLKELYKEVQMKYPTLGPVEADMEKMFAYVQYYFPKYKTPRVITLISEVDTEAKAFYVDTLALVSLDCYLGKDHHFYVDFPEYKKEELEAMIINAGYEILQVYGNYIMETYHIASDRMIIVSRKK
jgi:hypothetical protein